MAEVNDLRAEVEALRTEVAQLRSEQSAHICVQPVRTMFTQPGVNGAAGGVLPLIFNTACQPQTVVNVPLTTNACAGGGFLSAFTVNV